MKQPDSTDPKRRHPGVFAGYWSYSRVLLLMGLLCVSSSCAQRVAVMGGAPITLPDPPERVAWKEEGLTQKTGVHYLDPPVRLMPRQKCTAPPDGGVLLNPRAWRGIRYGLTEWPRWAETVRTIVKSHNEAVGEGRLKKHPWWAVWK
jgi:hypothetical protein